MVARALMDSSPSVSEILVGNCALIKYPCNDNSIAMDMIHVPGLIGSVAFKGMRITTGRSVIPAPAHERSAGGELLICIQGKMYANVWNAKGDFARLQLISFADSCTHGYVTAFWIPEMVWHEIYGETDDAIIYFLYEKPLHIQHNITDKNLFFKAHTPPTS